MRFLSRRRGNWTDWLAYAYLLAGVVIMFGPVVWLGLSSFKTPANLIDFPPTLLPESQQTVTLPGHPQPMPLYKVTPPNGPSRDLVEERRIGIVSTMIDPAHPGEEIKVPIEQRAPERRVHFEWSNYLDPLKQFNFLLYLKNSLVVTIAATLVTLLINSMAAFALSIYRFRGRDAVMLLVIGTLMIPITVILVPAYLVVTKLGMVNSLWGLILPGAATPTGVFLLRQYMLTLPRDLIEAARMDLASEWQIYWRIVLPLTAPALAVLAIFSIMWRWNEFLWPLVILNQSQVYTLQIGLNAFQGELQVQWQYLLAMTVVTLLPVALVFAFLQRFITSGIASTGMK